MRMKSYKYGPYVPELFTEHVYLRGIERIILRLSRLLCTIALLELLPILQSVQENVQFEYIFSKLNFVKISKMKKCIF